MLTPIAVAEMLVVTGIVPEKNISPNGRAVLVILYVSKKQCAFLRLPLVGNAISTGFR